MTRPSDRPIKPAGWHTVTPRIIVRGADTQQHDLTPESRGLLAIAQGFSVVFQDDHQQLAAELPVYDALYAWCRKQADSN